MARLNSFTTGCLLLVWILLSLLCNADNSRLVRRDAGQRRDELRQWCNENCVSEWLPWTPCNSRCGRGQMLRQRQLINTHRCNALGYFNCPHSQRYTVACNSGCPYGGLPGDNMCTGCPFTRTGQCCETEIFCPLFQPPANGTMEGNWPARPNSLLQFSCNAGFNLVGARLTLCYRSGSWSHPPPRCEAVSCGDPGSPVHGFRDGTLFTYGDKVTFHCHRGYELKGGSRTMECQSDAHWSGELPTCEVCPIGYYTDGDKCTKCPANSLTVSTASSSIDQCLCENSFFGPPGGPCEEVFCTKLVAPDNGEITDCGNRVGDVCELSCNDGFVAERGSTRRTCQVTGDWSRTQLSCVSCPVNTYKRGERICSPCPLHSHTEQPAQMLSGCVCDNGYEGPAGGPCNDINECLANQGKGPCSDTCENYDGGFRCGCSIPGYKLDPQNILTCAVEKQCRNLTTHDAPNNGGLVCHWDYEENSQQCTTKCNPGFELPIRTSDYEICGPSTRYTWSFQLENNTAVLVPCISEIFPDFRMEADSAYFRAACHNLTEVQKTAARQDFADRLNNMNVCSWGKIKTCNIEDMAIIPGRMTSRRK